MPDIEYDDGYDFRQSPLEENHPTDRDIPLEEDVYHQIRRAHLFYKENV